MRAREKERKKKGEGERRGEGVTEAGERGGERERGRKLEAKERQSEAGHMTHPTERKQQGLPVNLT